MQGMNYRCFYFLRKNELLLPMSVSFLYFISYHESIFASLMYISIYCLSEKYKINASVGNNCFYYSKSLNLIAESLVSRNILNEGALRQDLEEFCLVNPPLRL